MRFKNHVKVAIFAEKRYLELSAYMEGPFLNFSFKLVINIKSLHQSQAFFYRLVVFDGTSIVFDIFCQHMRTV